jgi:DNA-binding transcriptional regulator YhcF (GntR family)
MMLVRIDPTSDRSLNEQIAAGIRRAIVERSIGPGDRLPSAKQMAGALDVNMHTVLKAYARLRDEGLLEMRRGRGVTVLGRASATADLVELARRLVEEGRRVGLSAQEIRQLVEVQL